FPIFCRGTRIAYTSTNALWYGLAHDAREAKRCATERSVSMRELRCDLELSDTVPGMYGNESTKPRGSLGSRYHSEGNLVRRALFVSINLLGDSLYTSLPI